MEMPESVGCSIWGLLKTPARRDFNASRGQDMRGGGGAGDPGGRFDSHRLRHHSPHAGRPICLSIPGLEGGCNGYPGRNVRDGRSLLRPVHRRHHGGLQFDGGTLQHGQCWGHRRRRHPGKHPTFVPSQISKSSQIRTVIWLLSVHLWAASSETSLG
jgi:hypothetical protein